MIGHNWETCKCIAVHLDTFSAQISQRRVSSCNVCTCISISFGISFGILMNTPMHRIVLQRVKAKCLTDMRGIKCPSALRTRDAKAFPLLAKVWRVNLTYYYLLYAVCYKPLAVCHEKRHVLLDMKHDGTSS